MYDTIQYEEYTLHIVINPKLKHTYLSVSNEGCITIKMARKNLKAVYLLVQGKKSWIEKQLQKVASLQTLDVPMHSIEYLQSRVEYYSELMGLEYAALKFRKMKSRWGSCNSKRVITLNKELLKVPQEHLDYVVVHELAHLVYMDHSKAFHELVARYISDAKILRKELKNFKIV
ncbi:MAG: M48 family metallopeptidase [Epsilonproteobacteria bacterium]|nr:M48 family metallopeptidase [Campylobacterota bacterium]